MDTGNSKSFRPAVVQLEAREVPTVASVQLLGGVVTVRTNDEASNVAVFQSAAGVTVRDSITNQVWNYARSQVAVVNVYGGAGNDSFISRGNAGVSVGLYGNGGDDFLDGNVGPNTIQGGPGNDRLFGRGGRDVINGGKGDDYIAGGDGNDVLNGKDGADTVIGGQGIDAITGGPGDDVLVSIDGTNLDTVDAGGGGTDVLWIDNIDGVQEAVTGITAEDFIRPVAAFANGADLTLTRDDIPDPALLNGTDRYEAFADRPLFAAGGPTIDDIVQTTDAMGDVILDDSWLLSGLGAMLDAFPNLIKTNVVDFGDGTYGVRFNGTFYRVDNDLPVAQFGNLLPTYAGVGANNSLWVAIIEKAVATASSPVNPAYELIDSTAVGGINPSTIFALFGGPTQNFNLPTSFVSASQLGTVLEQAVASNFATVVSVTTGAAGAGLVDGQDYTLLSLLFDSAGDVSDVVLRDPTTISGPDGDGVVTVSIADLFATTGRLSLGNFNNV